MAALFGNLASYTEILTRHFQDTLVDITVANITINLTPGTDDTSRSVTGYCCGILFAGMYR
jgi:hypothetical protein